MLLVLLLAGSWGTLSAQPELDCRISLERLPAPASESTAVVPPEKCRVELECTLSEPPATGLRLIGILFPGQQIEHFDASFPETPVELEVKTRTVQVRLPRGLRGWSLSYDVQGDQRRIPILVPDRNWKTRVRVEVTLHGRKLAESSFPLLHPAGDRLQGTFQHLPGFIFLPLREAGQRGDVLSIRAWVDLSILILICGASLYWVRLRRQAGSELAGSGSPRQGED